VTLDVLDPGHRCNIVRVTGTDAITQRLMEMGLIRGSEVKVVRLAPLGDPMQITLLGYNLSLRKSEAARVEVEPCR
jgi:ferrous iron transport protein A